MNHIVAMNSYGIDLQDHILHGGQKYGRYMDLMYRLQKVKGGHDVDYRLTKNDFIIFRERIYVANNNDLKKTIL